MEVVEAIYEVYISPSKTKQLREYYNCNSGGSKKGEEFTLPTGSMKSFPGKCNPNHAYLSKSDKPDTLSYIIKSSGKSSEEFRILRNWRSKYIHH